MDMPTGTLFVICGLVQATGDICSGFSCDESVSALEDVVPRPVHLHLGGFGNGLRVACSERSEPRPQPKGAVPRAVSVA